MGQDSRSNVTTSTLIRYVSSCSLSSRVLCVVAIFTEILLLACARILMSKSVSRFLRTIETFGVVKVVCPRTNIVTRPLVSFTMMLMSLNGRTAENWGVYEMQFLSRSAQAQMLLVGGGMPRVQFVRSNFQMPCSRRAVLQYH